MTDENGSAANEQDGGNPKPKYYTPDDVSLHNCAEDCWLSLFGQVRETFTHARSFAYGVYDTSAQ